MKPSYHSLDIWHRAQALCIRMFAVSNVLPARERASLFVKLRDASEAIPMKIAHGATSRHMREYLSQLHECTQLLEKMRLEVSIAKHLHYISADLYRTLDEEIGTIMLTVGAMIRDLETKDSALDSSFAYVFPPHITN